MLSLHDSGNFSERVTGLPLATSSAGYIRTVVYSVEIPNLSVGDILVVMSEGEVTNDYRVLLDAQGRTFNVMIAGYLVLGESADATTGIDITEANGYNVTPDMHHGVVSRHGMIPVTDPSLRFVNHVMYAASGRSLPGQSLKVEQDYGRLQVLQFGT